MKRRLLSILLALSLIFTLLPVQAIAAGTVKPVDTTNPFKDVEQGDWYYDAVQYARMNGIFNGTSKTTFRPEGLMTRGMFVTVLGRMAGVNPGSYSGASSFTDVPEDAYYAPYVAWASKYGITVGTGSGKFSPNENINRQQTATFFVRYYEIFNVDYSTGANITTTPADIDSVSDYARDSVLKLWRQGLFVGDDVNFDPNGNATRAQVATICYRVDEVVETWSSEPGVPSTRVKIDPATGLPYVKKPKPSGGGTGYCSVTFYDGSRLIESFSVKQGTPLGKVPAVSKSSKAGAILEGYYTDPDFTTPFYAEEPVTGSITVYAQYEDIEGQEEVFTPTSFARMDQSPGLTFQIRRVSGSIDSQNAATLAVKDGTETVALKITLVQPPEPEPPEEPEVPEEPAEPEEPDLSPEPEELICTVAADPQFNEGCSYELTLAEGWVFVDEETGENMPETIRTAAFSIAMDEVHNMQMNEAIKFIEDTNDPENGDLTFQINGTSYEALTNSAVTQMGEHGSGAFLYDGASALKKDDILCVYVGVRPDQRSTGSEANQPAAYVKVSDVGDDGTVTFQALTEADQGSLYEIPDNFPLRVDSLPTEDGTVSFSSLDCELYAIMANMAGQEDEMPSLAESKLNTGDFVTFHTGTITSEGDIRFGKVTDITDHTITYVLTTEDEILHSMDLYDKLETSGDDILEELTEDERDSLEEELEEDITQSGFAEEAAYMLADLVTQTEDFQHTAAAQQLMAARAGSRARSGGKGGSFSLDGMPVVRARLSSHGGRFGGAEMEITVSATLKAALDDDSGEALIIDVTGSFTEEVDINPSVKGYATKGKILDLIPVVNGVHVDVSIDVKNYTGFSFDAEIYSTDDDGEIGGEIEHISSQLDKVMKAADEDAYQKSMDELMERYQEVVGREPGWITLVQQRMFTMESCVYGLCFGISGDFVVKADVSIALGSSMEYEVGKRFIFWFEVGLYTPAAGSSTMDLLDESFAFQLYVMGKITLRMGVHLRIYSGIGTGDFVSVAVTSELGPYVKFYGFFIYTCNRYRPKGSSHAAMKEQMDGAIGLELGLYFTLGVEASALKIFTLSHDFLDKEFPLFHAGDQEVYLGCAYRPEEDEALYVVNESPDSDDIVMTIPSSMLAVDTIQLSNGNRGSQTMPLDQYFFSVSNPNFSLEKVDNETLKVHVEVPENVHLLRCGLTVTYKGKQPLSNYDISTTIPLIWTDLSQRQMKEYFTASVRVGNNIDGYDTVWRQKVLRGEEFELPDPEEIKTLARWNDYRYEDGTGYGDQQTTSLGITQDTVYDYNVNVKSYSVTVTGIEGSAPSSRTYTAKYGEEFNFSNLKGTGIDGPDKYTKFAGIEDLSADGEPIDLTQPINQRTAQALSSGATVSAKYADDSATAVFSFQGIELEDVTTVNRRGKVPKIAPAEAAVENYKSSDPGLKNLAIVGYTPEYGPAIDTSKHYIVECLNLSGERADVTFDANPGGFSDSSATTSVNKLVGSILAVGIVSEPTRYGYNFVGWACGGSTVYSIVVPEEGDELTAQWEPKTFTLSLIGNGGYTDGESSNTTKTITFDAPYGTLPKPTWTGYRFVGWYTEPEGGTQVTESTVLTTEGDKTVYAHWKPLIKLPKLFICDQMTVTFDKDKSYDADDVMELCNCIRNGTDYDEEGNPIPTDGFYYEVKREDYNSSADGMAHDAGSYYLEITRHADDLYASYTQEFHDIFVINKANWKESVLDQGLFKIQIECKATASFKRVTTVSTIGDTCLEENIISGMELKIHKAGSGFNGEGNYAISLNAPEPIEENGGSGKVTITLVFQNTASKNYILDSEIEIGTFKDMESLRGTHTLP